VVRVGGACAIAAQDVMPSKQPARIGSLDRIDP
jgi:hypothetical protein